MLCKVSLTVSKLILNVHPRSDSTELDMAVLIEEVVDTLLTSTFLYDYLLLMNFATSLDRSDQRIKLTL